MTIMLVAVGLVFAAIFGFEAFRAKMIQKAIAGLRNPPQTVSTITATTQQWQDRLEAVGSTRSEKGADLSPQVAGIVKAIHFQSGEKVEQGTLLDLNEACRHFADGLNRTRGSDHRVNRFGEVVEIRRRICD